MSEGRAREARRFRNQQELDKTRRAFTDLFDALQHKIDTDQLDNITLDSRNMIRDITADDDAWTRHESAKVRVITLCIVNRGEP